MTISTAERTQIRRTIIDMALRRQRPGSGSARSFQQQRSAVMQWPDLSPVLGTIPWAVVGAAATRLYMPERATQDLDVAIAVQNSEAAQTRLRSAGYRLVGELSIGGSTWRTPTGEIVDLIEGSEEWWSEALAGAGNNRDAQGLPVLPLPYLVLMKFRASRARDLGDISQMLGLADDGALAEVRRIFAIYAPKDQADLESLILLGKMEME
ncbi:MAG: hypothetical protein WBO46_00170 [Caldilineaceae bacterium]